MPLPTSTVPPPPCHSQRLASFPLSVSLFLIPPLSQLSTLTPIVSCPNVKYASPSLFFSLHYGLYHHQDKKTHYRNLTKSHPGEFKHPYGARYGTTPIPKYHLPSKVSSSLPLSPSCFNNTIPRGQTQSLFINSSTMSSALTVPRFSTWLPSYTLGCQPPLTS